MKKIIVLLVVLLLVASTIQVAFADPAPPNIPDTGGSCHMIASWWLDEDGNWTGPGNPNPNGVQDGDRGMVHVHTKSNPNGYTNGAQHMDDITIAHCG